MLNINKSREGASACFALEGRLDTTTAPDLERELKSGTDGVTELVLDCAKLDYISSAGLRVLLSTHKAMSRNGMMKVKNVNDVVQEVFEVTGFSDILNIE